MSYCYHKILVNVQINYNKTSNAVLAFKQKDLSTFLNV